MKQLWLTNRKRPGLAPGRSPHHTLRCPATRLWISIPEPQKLSRASRTHRPDGAAVTLVTSLNVARKHGSAKRPASDQRSPCGTSPNWPLLFRTR